MSQMNSEQRTEITTEMQWVLSLTDIISYILDFVANWLSKFAASFCHKQSKEFKIKSFVIF